MGRFGRWLLVVFVVVGLARAVGGLRDVQSSSEAYSALIGTQRPTFVKVYADGCRYCAELAPHFAFLEQVFGEEIELLSVDGRQARRFVHDMGVRSFPELLLFQGGASDEQEVRTRSFVGKHDGARGAQALASYVSEHTGVLARWPGSVVHDVGDPHNWPDLELLLQQHPALIALVSPWMDADHLNQFNGELATSILELLGNRYKHDGLVVYRVDASDSRAAHWTNTLRCSFFPTIVLSLAGKSEMYTPENTPLIKFEFLSITYPGADRMSVTQRLEELLEHCFVHPAGCREYVNDLPHASYYESLAELRDGSDTYPTQFQDISGDESDESYDYYDLDEDEMLFGSLRDL